MSETINPGEQDIGGPAFTDSELKGYEDERNKKAFGLLLGTISKVRSYLDSIGPDTKTENLNGISKVVKNDLESLRDIDNEILRRFVNNVSNTITSALGYTEWFAQGGTNFEAYGARRDEALEVLGRIEENLHQYMESLGI